MERPVSLCDMPPQRFMEDGYAYIGDDEKWHIKNDAPDWAKKEFIEFYAMVNPVPDKDGVVVQG